MVSTLNRRNVVDPAVADMLTDLEHKKRITNLPKSKQVKARKEAARHKVGLDLPPKLHESLSKIAERESISVSGLVAFYLYQGVAEYNNGNVELSHYKRLSRCARFEYVLDLTKLENS
jgi:hypothetical protein